MNRRKQLEEQRTRITEFYDCLQEQVDAGILNKEMARQIAQREYPNKTYSQLVDDIDAQLAQLPPPSKRKMTVVHVAALGMVLVLTFGLVLFNGGTTGLFTFSDEEFYNYGFTQTYTEDGITVLPIEATISSLRMDGEISGTGKANVWLQSGTTRSLLASFDASQETSPLTGFVTAVTDLVGITEDNSINETNSTEPIAVTPDETHDDSDAASNSTPDGTTTTNTTESETIELTPSTPSQEEAVIPPVRPSTKQLSNDCIETCSIEGSEGPFMLIVDIEGEATVRIDSLIYGVLPEDVTSTDTTDTTGTTEPIDPGAPRPDSSTTEPTAPSAPETPTTPTENPVETPTETPTDTSGVSEGTLCTEDSDCGSGSCKIDRFQGAEVAGRCVPQESYCVTQQGIARAGTSSGDSTCYATSTGSIWLASAGSGRYEIKNSAGDAVAIIDKYGNMAISGSASFSTPAPRDGWMMESKSGTPTLSISSSGDLLAAGVLMQNTRPTPTAGNDFIVKDGSGNFRAVFTENGAVQLAGVFSSDAALG